MWSLKETERTEDSQNMKLHLPSVHQYYFASCKVFVTLVPFQEHCSSESTICMNQAPEVRELLLCDLYQKDSCFLWHRGHWHFVSTAQQAKGCSQQPCHSHTPFMSARFKMHSDTGILKIARQIFPRHILCATSILQQKQSATVAVREKGNYNCIPSSHLLIKAVGKMQVFWTLDPTTEKNMVLICVYAQYVYLCMCVCAAGMHAQSSQLPVSGVFHGTLHSPGTLTAQPGDLALIPLHPQFPAF